jgi:hypothetical protein
MPDTKATATPAPRGPFFTHFGPDKGPVAVDCPALGVLADRTAARPIGIACAEGCAEYRGMMAKTFRLVVNKVLLEGRWVCVGREFIQLSEAAEGQ